jgi:hypothetical protein
MARQSNYGKAFEYACLKAFYEGLQSTDNIVEVIGGDAHDTAKRDYDTKINDDIRSKMNLAARAGVRSISRLEPRLANASRSHLLLTLQTDSAGMEGDVRDMIALRSDQNWEVGISCKHNHEALKHQRLSKTIDFGDKWLEIPCSQQYFNEINPIFDDLQRKKDAGVKWREIENKMENYYVPVLQSFMDELGRLYHGHPDDVPERLLRYIIGNKDFYKIISLERRNQTMIQGFQMYSTLNKSQGNIRPSTRITQLNFPTRVIDISFKRNSKTTVNVVFDQGWQVSLRIHSAKTLVETSLKFDANLVGSPNGLYTEYESW